MGEVYGTQQRPRKRRGRRLLITLIVFLVLLGAVLVGLDRFAASYAERMISDRVAEQVADQQATSEKPDVTIEGVPFLTQVLDGRYQEIHIQLPHFSGPAGNGRTLRTDLLDVRATDVDAPLDTLRSGNGDIVAGAVTGTGTIDYAQVAELINQPGLKLAEQNGKLVGSAPVQALGQTFDVSGAATVAVKDNVVQIRFSDVTAAGLPDVPIVKNLIASYVQKLAVDLTVPELPLNLKVQKVEPQPDGLRFTAGATNVPLNTGGL
ncbi:hypothetical protein Ade02nite_66040 [Paractinoplanes deccanensis]|uniref:DUF2993 domain-containing protein n=1 Tax=Paractinoplanes deccanensis TaxID=113561 RepID=A0ABQ3YD77_9ACTN|nr:DUF2993 domain-containing protein [Actinoplanes deccanensis]GID77963.1 hypothetical protein Ade02nite_66040 [Actinoplanes deccanensis]